MMNRTPEDLKQIIQSDAIQNTGAEAENLRPSHFIGLALAFSLLTLGPGSAAVAGTLQEALDNTALAFTVGGDANWFYQTDTAYYDGDAAESGEISDSQTTYLETTIDVSEPSMLSFWWAVSSEEGYDFLNFYVDNTQTASISGDVDWQKKEIPLSPGEHSLKWEYSKDESFSEGYDAGWVDNISLARIVPLNEALDNSELTFTEGGHAIWYGQSRIAYYDGDAAQSGQIGDNQRSYFQTTIDVTEPSALTFRWKVSSEEGDDYLKLLKDGLSAVDISGEVDWQQEIVPLFPGQHTLTWEYSKGRYGGSEGQDAGWVDQVSLLRNQSATMQEWTAVFGGAEQDTASSLQQTNDGGYIVTGSTRSFGAGGSDILLIKLDSNAYMQWARTYGGTSDDSASSIQRTSDGGYIVAGSTRSFGAGGSDIWLLKLDEYGDIQWEKTYGTANEEGAKAIQQTDDGGFIVLSSTYSSGHAPDVLLLKLDEDGRIQWQAVYSGSDIYSFDYGRSILALNDGYLISGYSATGGRTTPWVSKLSKTGDVLWKKTYGQGGFHSFTSIQQVDNGFIVVGSYYHDRWDTYDIWVVKIDQDGRTVWQKRIPGLLTSDNGYSATQTGDGGFIVLGMIPYKNKGIERRDIFITKIDEYGNMEWHRAYGGRDANDVATSIIQDSDGGYVLAGYTESFSSGGGQDMWILKLDKDGRVGHCGAEEKKIGAGPQDTSATVSDGSFAVADTSISAQVTHAETDAPNLSSRLQCWSQASIFESTTNEPPVIDAFAAQPVSGAAPLSTTLTCQAHDPDGAVAVYEFDFGDGSEPVASEAGQASHTYQDPGNYQASCTAYDDREAPSDPVTVAITVAQPSWQEITGQLQVSHSPRQLYDRLHRVFFSLITVKNPGAALAGPIRMVIVDPSLPVQSDVGAGLEPDGFTDEGYAYFVIVPDGGTLGTGQSLRNLRVNFQLQHKRLTYGVRIEQFR